jgi:hypothetical protein
MRRACAAAAVWFAVVQPSAGQIPPPSVSGPTQWIAFSADIHINFANGREAGDAASRTSMAARATKWSIPTDPR